MTSARFRLVCALLLSGCAAPAPAPTAAPATGTPATAAAAPTVGEPTPGEPDAGSACAATTESAMLSAERGIGGTGVAAGVGSFAEQGIGGTGIGSGIGGTGIGSGIGGTGIGSGIGGTGSPGILLRGRPGGAYGAGRAIVGPITGFSGLCLAGVAVAVNRPVQMFVDGQPRQSETLHLGQIATVEARNGPTGPYAVSVAIHHEVSGPIAAINPGGGAFEVAGQHVVLAPRAHAPAGLHVGDWVAVSGLRDPTGGIQATRVDLRDPGDVLVAGQPERTGDGWMLGALALRFPPGMTPAGGRVRLVGQDDRDVLHVTAMSDDPLLPAGGAVRRFTVEGFATTSGPSLMLAGGLRAAIGPDMGAPPPTDRPVVVQFVIDDHETLVALSWRPAP